MVWGMEFDNSGNLWFTDQVNNAIWRYFVDEERFGMYKVPTAGSYPSQIDFDSRGRVWFSEILGIAFMYRKMKEVIKSHKYSRMLIELPAVIYAVI